MSSDDNSTTSTRNKASSGAYGRRCGSEAIVQSWEDVQPSIQSRPRSRSRSDTCRRRTRTTHTRCTIPELLRLRSTNGMNNNYNTTGDTVNHRLRCSSNALSYWGAWNTKRLQNSILVVGPGTPASMIYSSSLQQPKYNSDTTNNDILHGRDDDDGDEDDSDDDNEDGETNQSSLGSPSSDSSSDNNGNLEEDLGSIDGDKEEDHNRMDEDNVDDNDNDDDNESDDDDNDSPLEEFYDYMQNTFSDTDSDNDDGGNSTTTKVVSNYRPSMRHGGCVNTAAWITSDCGWRLSTAEGSRVVGVSAVASTEIATQVVTSGDDRLLKVWDVSEAMGNSSPLHGGMTTMTPFSSSSASWDKKYNVDGYKEKWQSFIELRRRRVDGDNNDDSNDDEDEDGENCGNCTDSYYRPPGTVRLLANVKTGHKGNVFHVTPLKGRPGKFATCGADGYLRLVDIEASSGNNSGSSNGTNSTVVIHPMYSNDDDETNRFFDPENPLAFFLRNTSGMCFSHSMVDDHVGLLCSEKGLIRFDLRLSPREQSTKSLLPRTTRSSSSTSMVRSSIRSCKACAILPVNDGSSSCGSTYAFAGGSSPAVALCDLRMTADSSQHSSMSSNGSRVLQYYSPASLSDENSVSVSGLDLSRDSKELLVSYESDQIYTFPIFPYSQSPRRSAKDQLMELLDKTTSSNDSYDDDNNDGDRRHMWRKGKRILPEMKVRYGAHLNRFTFLKNATYAGPRDEYICTGSDSGHAWIYEKATGAVVSFWKADQSTCNGIVPHPTIPFFITFGIDSTAKLWRSTIPVDSEVDDSTIGRRKHFRMKQNQSYATSPTVRDWDKVQSTLENIDLQEAGSLEESEIFPDQIPCSKVVSRHGRLARSWMRESHEISLSNVTGIYNDLHNLPKILEENLFVVLRSLHDDDDVPIESDIENFKRSVSYIRLRHQADSLGLTCNPTIPWMMQCKSTGIISQESMEGTPEDHQVHPSELIPVYPSDWIPYDPDMNNDPFDFRDYFCCSKSDMYADFYRDRYQRLNELGAFLVERNKRCDSEVYDYDPNAPIKNKGQPAKNVDRDIDSKNAILSEPRVSLEGEDSDDAEQKQASKDNAMKANYSTHNANRILAETVKTLKNGGNDAFKHGNLGLAAHRYDKAIQYGSVSYMNNRKIQMGRFDDLLKNLIMTRLNIALVLLTDSFMDPASAAKQAKLAMNEISPYCDPNNNQEEKSIVDEAFALKAKAYFRLGTAQYEMGDYSDAIFSLEESIKSSKQVSDPTLPDPIVLRRLAHAKRENLKQTKRQRKKFKFAFASSASSPSCPTPTIPLPMKLPSEDNSNSTDSDASVFNPSTAGVTASNDATTRLPRNK